MRQYEGGLAAQEARLTTEGSALRREEEDDDEERAVWRAGAGARVLADGTGL